MTFPTSHESSEFPDDGSPHARRRCRQPPEKALAFRVPKKWSLRKWSKPKKQLKYLGSYLVVLSWTPQRDPLVPGFLIHIPARAPPAACVKQSVLSGQALPRKGKTPRAAWSVSSKSI